MTNFFVTDSEDRNDQLRPGSVFDSHCHLEFYKRRNAAITSLSDCMKRDGEKLGDKFRGCIVNFCDPAEWSCGAGGEKVSSLLREAASDERVGISLGCHPHFASKMTPARWRQLRRLLSGSCPEFSWLEVVAVGECGLDYSKKNSCDRQLQQEVFELQLRLAMEWELPLVLHIRDAEEDGLVVLERAGLPPAFPLHRHCFGSDVSAAAAWLEKYPASMIGVTGLITHQDQLGGACQVVANTRLDRLLLETDAPYFLPSTAVSNTWNCSFPGHVIHVAARVAQIKKVNIKSLNIWGCLAKSFTGVQ